MATRLRERVYTPLSPSETRALLKEAQGRLDGLADHPGDPNDDGYTELEVLDDVSLSSGESVPHGARGTPEALERAAQCRSALTIDYYGRVFETAPFIALEKLILSRAGAAVVWRGEAGEEPQKGATIVTAEAFSKEREKEVGPKWRKTAPLGSTEEEPARKPLKTRAAKPGELEALAVHKRLARIIEGNDPFARDALKKALEQTTSQVRAYAAALMENGPTPDAALSKELGMSSRDVESAREALKTLLSAIR